MRPHQHESAKCRDAARLRISGPVVPQHAQTGGHGLVDQVRMSLVAVCAACMGRAACATPCSVLHLISQHVRTGPGIPSRAGPGAILTVDSLLSATSLQHALSMEVRCFACEGGSHCIQVSSMLSREGWTNVPPVQVVLARVTCRHLLSDRRGLRSGAGHCGCLHWGLPDVRMDGDVHVFHRVSWVCLYVASMHDTLAPVRLKVVDSI
jgi:hypothetical protein